MARTQSMPGTNATGHLLYSPQIRPESPTGSPGRIRIPRKPTDEAFPPSTPTRVSVLDHERKLPERSSSPNMAMGITQSTTMPKLRRPSSPLCQVVHPAPTSAPATTPSSGVTSSPSYRPYDSFSGGSSYSTGYPPSSGSNAGYSTGYPPSSGSSSGYLTGYPPSSVPSTPTSARSRSPSISSLETIPDSPDAEEAALEAERIAQLKAAADAAEGGDAKGRGSLDVPARGRTLSGFGSRDKRKRWSVCGAERRQDLDLETIWED